MNESGDTRKTTSLSSLQTFTTSLPFLFIVGILIFLVSFVISSFPLGRNPIKQNQIQRVYFADNIAAGHSSIIQKFNEIHEGEIEVIAIDLPFRKFNTNQRKELIARNLRSRGSRIDVFSVDLIWLHRFTKWAEPLTPYFSPASIETMLPSSLNTCYVDGVLYAIPMYTDIGALYYREDIIKSLPDGEALLERIKQSISWEELLEIKRKHFPQKPIYIPQADAYEGLICNFNEILGIPLQHRDTGEILNLTDAFVVRKTQFFRDMFVNGIAPLEALDMTEDDCISYALTHDIPFVRGWPTLNNETDPRFDPEMFKKLRIAPMPHFEGENSAPVFGGWNMMLSRHSPVKEAAILFMQFASSVEGQTIFYEAEGLLPIQETFYDTARTDRKRERLASIEKMMANGIHRPALDHYTLLSDILSERLHLILSGELEVEAGLKLAKEEISIALQRGTSF